MEIQLVRSFLAVVRTGSVTAAARELGYSQPAITAHLNAFDRQAGGSVLERGRGGAILTPLGERMLPRAARVVAEHDALLAEASDAGGTGTHLVVGYATSTILPYVERLAQIAARALPRVRLSLVALERPAQIGNDLLAHLVDLQVVPGPLDDPRLVSRLLHPLRVGVRVTAASPLAPMASVPLEVILGRPLHRLEGVPLAWDRYWCAWIGHGGPPEPGRDVGTFAECLSTMQDRRHVMICPSAPFVVPPTGDVWRPLTGVGEVWLEIAHRANDHRPAVRAVASLAPATVRSAPSATVPTADEPGQGWGASTTLAARVSRTSAIG
ncbi:LysR family transcriptional regulator [Arsenicicoccus bolidensis]|uniref:LysR family transcriptional regulator n=1 Tax=Arsenicicoccus bolidensis TaxID=229480 RepID=UPI0028B1FC20|nr:LysR family transcriptional regulator [Arsenicicoccus bolidensis]